MKSNILEKLADKLPREYFLIKNEINLKIDRPWYLIEDQYIDNIYNDLKKRYKSRNIFPFAMRVDNDDKICFDLDNNSIVLIHDFSSPGWEFKKNYKDIWEWLHEVVEDMKDYSLS